MKAYKELKKLWNDLNFYLYMGRYDKASCVSDKIDEYKKEHPVAYYISFIFH